MNKRLKRAHLEDSRTAMSLNRRDFIYGMGASLGSVALAGMMSQNANASEAAPGPLAQKKPHLPPKGFYTNLTNSAIRDYLKPIPTTVPAGAASSTADLIRHPSTGIERRVSARPNDVVAAWEGPPTTAPT